MKKGILFVSAFLLLPFFAHADITTGLVGNYALDEGSGTSATNSTGSGTGVLTNGPTWTTGKIGTGAVTFDGSNDYIDLSTLSFTPGTGDFSVSAWIKPTGTGLTIAAATNAVNGNNFWLGSDTAVRFSVNGETAVGGTIVVGAWNHVLGVRRGGNLYVYLNGQLVGGPVPSAATVTSGGIAIGKFGTSGGFNFSGSIDDVRFYNAGLSDADALALYSYTGGGTTNPPPTPVNGSCSTTVNQCTAGTFLDQTDSQTQNLWQCTGSNGGTTASCSATIQQSNPTPTGSNVYVAQNSAGTNDGSSCANAIAVTATYMTTAANWTPGKTFHLCGTISTPIAVLGSGTAGNPITIYFEPNAKMSAPAFAANSQTGGAITIDHKDYVTIDGGTNGIIENTNNGTNLGLHVESSGVSGQVANYLTVKNLTIRNLYVRSAGTEQSPWSVMAIRNKNTSNSSSFTGFYVYNNKINDVMAGIEADYGNISDIQWHDNTIQNVNFGMVMADRGGGSALANGVSVYNNKISGFSNWNDTSASNSFHHNGVYMWGESGGKLNNINVYGNEVGPGFGGANQTSGFYFSGLMDGIKIYNNIFLANAGEYAATGLIYLLPFQSDGTSYDIYNNTFIGGGLGAAIDVDGPASPKKVTVNIKNNIGSGRGNGTFIAAYDAGGVNFNINNNISYNFDSFSNSYSMTNSGAGKTFAQWQALGFDLNGSTQNPLLDSFYKPQTGSPAIDRGATISYITADKAGISRPQGSAYDIGAFEVPGGGGGTTPPPIIGDFNNDGAVNSIDMSLMAGAWNTTNATYDLNGDGRVNTLDYVIMVRNWTN